MPKYIKLDTLKELMYHEAFEKDSDMQRWDSGCWIRYKMFENVVADIPTADEKKIATEYCTKRRLVMLTIDTYEKLIFYYNRGINDVEK